MKHFFNRENPMVTLLCCPESVEEATALFLAAEADGADGIAVELTKLPLESRTREKYRSMMDSVQLPFMFIDYRNDIFLGANDEARQKYLLLAAEAGAEVIDVMGDLYDPSPMELTHDPAAIEKQRLLIDKIHALGARVIMSSHMPDTERSAEEVLDHMCAQSSRGADILKVVVGMHHEAALVEGVRTLLLLRRKLDKPFVFLGAGKYGRFIRYVSLNGVKKTAATMDKRRSWKSALEKSLFQSRMSAKTLDAMISVMEESLPEFRKYLNKKAELLGIKKLAFYDLFAPISQKGFTPKVWNFEEARDYIIQTFGIFAPDMGLFAKNAFANGWIDSPPHAGKVGGAYCTSFPIAKESRVMCNFSPTFSGVSTIAHELGHAYHFHLLREECAFARAYPMTLAETASIFSETMLYNTTISKAKGFEKKYLTEMFLMEVTQVIVDILCRFYFEKAVFEKQKEGPLSADALCSMMTDAQKATYGDALDPKLLHPYMWAVKCHYYSPDLGFYNYPYAFGQLFSIGLYVKYLEDKKNFPALYRKVLMATGRTDIKGVAKLAGIDVEKKDFFQESMDFITRMIRIFLR